VTRQDEGLVIRPMEEADIQAVMAIDRLSFPLPWSKSMYRFELKENHSARLFVAARQSASGRQLVGYVGFWFIIDEAHISTLAVHPDVRKRGIGAELLKAAMRRAIALGAETVTLEVRASNKAAIRLYEKFGFEVVGRRRRYYRDNNEDALLMACSELEAPRLEGMEVQGEC
jgi:ribosomal-protein-alanine N-acetyltransferase